MRSAIIFAALALAIGASATVNIEYYPDGSVKRISNSHSSARAPAKLARSAGGRCSKCRDQCLRGVISASAADADFCTLFLAATYSLPIDFAPVQTQCASDADRVSSACSCLLQPTTSSSAVPTTTSTEPTEPTDSSESSSISSSTESTESSSIPPSTTELSSTPSASPTAPVCGMSDGLCNIDNFQTCCVSQCCYFPTGNVQDGICC